MKALIEARKKLKSRKPEFDTQERHKRKEVRQRWRRPRGKHSKMRLHKRGHKKMPSQGWRSPKAVRNYSGAGIAEVLVKNAGDIKKAKENQGIVIAKVGKKKRLSIIKEALAKGIKILNIKNPEGYEKRTEDEKRKAEKKEKKVEETKKETIEEKVSEEDKKKMEKQEKDKLLTRRGT